MYREGVGPTADDVRTQQAAIRDLHRQQRLSNNPYAALAWEVHASQRGSWTPQGAWNDRAEAVGGIAPEAFGNRSLPRGHAVYATDAPTVDDARRRAQFVREMGLVPSYGGSAPSASLNTSAPGFWASRLGNEVAQRQRKALPDIIG